MLLTSQEVLRADVRSVLLSYPAYLTHSLSKHVGPRAAYLAAGGRAPPHLAALLACDDAEFCDGVGACQVPHYHAFRTAWQRESGVRWSQDV